MTHRRILADPTQKKPKNKNHHPQPDPTIPDPPPLSTIQNISHRFSRLYANHKKQVSSHSSSKPGPLFPARKDPFFTPVSDTSRTTATNTLSKSSSLKERNDKKHHLGAKTEAKEKPDAFKKPFSAEKIASFEEGNNNRRRSSVSCMPPPVVNEGGGRRRSFCNSQVELADFLSCSGVKVVAVDMPPFMQVHAVDCARKAHDSLEKFTSKTLACTLKKEFDGVYGPAWHCIVGTSFGSFVTHSVGGFMYFSMDHKLYILLFKTTVQKADD